MANLSGRYVIALFLGTAYLDRYSPGYSLGNINQYVHRAAFVYAPDSALKYYDEGNLKDVKTVISYPMKYFLALAIPSVVEQSLLSKPLLTIFSIPEIAKLAT